MPPGMEVDLNPGDFVLDVGTHPQIFGPCLLWPNDWMDQDGTWHTGRPRPRRLCVRWRPSPLSKKGAEPSPLFGQTAAWIKMPLGTEAGLGLRDIVLDGDPTSPPLKGHSPRFSANVRCGQTAGWTKIPLGMELGLGPGDFVFDGTQVPREKGHTTPPNFWPMSMEVGIGPGDFVFDGDPATPRKKARHPNPIFGPYLLWPNGWMDQDATW